MSALFGPAGNSDSFKEKGYKHTLEVPSFLASFGLKAYEYQCGHGVRISEEKAKQFGEAAREQKIVLSVHSPYYISLSSIEEQKRKNSIQYIRETAVVAQAMGASRIVVHSGSCAKISREQALALAKQTLTEALSMLEEEGLHEITLCPETMGKVNQLGTLEEVVELCRMDERLLPCIDFGHLYARTFGALQTKEDYRAILDYMENALGYERLQHFHSHFSRIAFTPQGGEKAHLTFEDREYGPDFEPLLELVLQKNLSPTFICESAGTQAEDAAQMQRVYWEKKGEKKE